MNQAEIFSDVDLPVRRKTFQKTLQKMFENFHFILEIDRERLRDRRVGDH